MDTEIWKEIVGFEGYYEISNLGRIRSLDRKVIGRGNKYRPIKSKIKNPTKDKDGYLRVYLFKNNQKHLSRGVHQLVAVAFVDNPYLKKVVNHKDGDKNNNYFSNLEWVTAFENEKHAQENGLKARGGNGAWSKLKPEEIVNMREMEKEGWCFSELAKVFNVSVTHVSRIINKIWWKHI